MDGNKLSGRLCCRTTRRFLILCKNKYSRMYKDINLTSTKSLDCRLDVITTAILMSMPFLSEIYVSTTRDHSANPSIH